MFIVHPLRPTIDEKIFWTSPKAAVETVKTWVPVLPTTPLILVVESKFFLVLPNCLA